MTVSPFRIEERQENGWLRLALIGELELASAPAVDERLVSLRGLGSAVIVDLSGVTFMDSSGLQVLVNAVTAARRDGWRLQIDRTLPEQVRRLVELTQLEELFGVERGTDHAYRGSSRPGLPTSHPTCAYCEDVIGVYERAVAVEHEGERETSLAHEPDLAQHRGVLLVHSRCAPAGWRAGRA